LAGLSYLLSFGGRLGRGGAVVLCYPGVSEEQGRAFARQMSGIAPRAVPLARLPETGSYRLGTPPRVCVTFDDGFENLLANAVPVLEQLGVPATLFVVPENLGRPPHWTMRPGHPDARERLMDALQVRKLVHDHGWRVESHTLTHAHLPSLPAAEVRRELSESKAALESALGVPITAVAFPHGAYNQTVLEEARRTGYVSACTLEPRLYRGGQEHRIGRFLMSPDAWSLEFYLTCAGAYVWVNTCRRLLTAGWRWLARRK